MGAKVATTCGICARKLSAENESCFAGGKGGIAVGINVGEAVRTGEGANEGVAVGTGESANEGDAVGNPVGLRVGEADGANDG